MNPFPQATILSNCKRLALCTTFVVAAAAVPPDAGAASAPKKTQPKSDLREKANEHFEQGERLRESYMYKDAAKHYKKAIIIDPNYAEAYSNLGYCYKKYGMYDKAIMQYGKAIDLKPELAEAHEYLGETYAEMGNFSLAEKELEILEKLESGLAQTLEKFIAEKKAATKDADAKP